MIKHQRIAELIKVKHVRSFHYCFLVTSSNERSWCITLGNYAPSWVCIRIANIFLIRLWYRILFTVGNVDRDIGRHSGRCSGRQSVDIVVDSRSIVGRDTVDSRSRCVSADIAFRSPTLRRLFADTSPIVGRYLTDVSVSNWSTLGRWSVDT